MAAPSWRLAFGLAKETTWGTPVTVATFFPMKKPSGFVPQYEDIDDDGFRNNASNLQGYYEGFGMTPFDTGEMLFYPDDTCHLIMAMLGVDTITGAGPYTHTLTLLNNALTPSYTLALFDSLLATSRQISGAQFSDLIIKWTSKGKLTVQAKGIGKIAGTVTKPAEAYSAAAPYLGWQFTANVGGANTKLEEVEIALKRVVDFEGGANNTQDAADRVVEELAVTGTMTFVPTDDTEKTFYTANTQPASSIVFTSGTNTLTFQMTKTAFRKGSDLTHDTYRALTKLPFEAVANATDAGTGNSPLKIIAVNARSTAL